VIRAQVALENRDDDVQMLIRPGLSIGQLLQASVGGRLSLG
jgi:hypothetical protein